MAGRHSPESSLVFTPERVTGELPEADIEARAHAGRAHRLRTRLALSGIALLLLLLLIVTPPLLKLNRYAHEIAVSMSQSLGRPVHLDNVTLGLLPMPHLTLENVVVSEDPAFGSEPTLRANTVEARLRLSSLWRRPMEFSRVLFVEPSVNLVRSRDGHWNLEGVLLHASQVDTAPTAQRHRGRTPRFPYIEATGGRVNLKIGQEKKPFSLVDTDFALWLPSPDRWNLRLTGTPARTDTHLTDSGVVRLEGSLERAAHMNLVPVDLRASWHDAPLGEATRLVTGADMGWRGTLQADAVVKGSLGAGRLATEVTLDDLRRADFVPAHALSVHLHCASLADVPAADLKNLACELPVGGSQPLRLQAPTVDLTRPQTAELSLQAQAAPLEWFASWARLLSPRFPLAPALPGTLDATLSRGAAGGGSVPVSAGTSAPSEMNADAEGAGSALGGWLGKLTLHLPAPQVPTAVAGAAGEGFGSGKPTDPGAAAKAATAGSAKASQAAGAGVASPNLADSGWQTVVAEVTPGPEDESGTFNSGALNFGTLNAWILTLPATQLRLSDSSQLSFSGTAWPGGYSLHAAGTVPPVALLRLAQRVPPLSDGLREVLGISPESKVDDTPQRLDLTCTRAWNSAAGDQVCTRAPELVRKTGKRR